MKVAAFQKLAAKGYACVICIAKEGVFDYHTCAAACLEHFDKVLHKKIGCFAGFNGEVLLDF